MNEGVAAGAFEVEHRGVGLEQRLDRLVEQDGVMFP
jgi:hypothetical protein